MVVRHLVRNAWTGSLLLGCAAALLATESQAQQTDWDPRRVYASREALQDLARRFEAAAASPAYSLELRAEARTQANQISQRLTVGDFQAGDRLFMSVERETGLTDTLTVVTGASGDPTVILPNVGSVSLKGVLRSETEVHLRNFVARFVRDPVVRTRTFIRISITGEVTRPGFYNIPTDLVITDALVAAQGVTPRADLSAVEIRRQNRTLWESAALRDQIATGRTLDQLDVRSGDQIVIGARSRFGLAGFEGPLRAMSILLALPITVVGLVALF